MKKWLPIFLAASIFSFANEKEEKGQELCSFTSEIFTILEDQSHIVDPENLAKAYASSIKRLQSYENGENPELADLAEKFIDSLKEDEVSKEMLGDLVSSLGRLVKCSVDDEYYRTDTPYLLHKEDIQKEIQSMEAHLGDRLPKGDNINFHKLMIESLADQKYDMALYAYFKIAETRCQKS
ncbi:MAG: hypothetical protein KFB93_04490 [Simkaniaceae bacterium]|nr:MAG: hypothetical protein KFB93_04490 [Simkaniaceae bacterium]